MSALAFFFIVVSLLSFVAAQLILKRAMEFSAANGCAIPVSFPSLPSASL